MEQLLYSETFFLISSICLVFITLLVIVALIYVVNIMRVVYEVTKIVKKKTSELSSTLDDIGDQIVDSKIVTFLSLFTTKKKKAKKTIVK
jgi:hypothetical protein